MPIKVFTNVAEAQAGPLRRIPLDAVTVSSAVQVSLDRLFGPGTSPAQAVDRILLAVREDGDQALFHWSKTIEGVELDSLLVDQATIKDAYTLVDPDLVAALQVAAGEIERFHQKQARQSWVDWSDEGALGQLVVPLQRVGVYAPGGTAPLPSSLLMAAIPARVAGVEEIVVCSPPQRATGEIHPLVLVAADIAGVQSVYRLGGAQAIGALAYGTATIPQVDKIAGPGNLFVVLAKKAVYGTVDIEALPGPTETLVIADHLSDPGLCAADMLAQAEHDPLASAILLTPSLAFAHAVEAEIAHQLEELDRAEIAAAALTDRSAIVVVESLEQAIALSNAYGPEHLCLALQNPWPYVGSIRNAGGIFLGERSFEVLGDYVAGPSHIMPTGGTARYASPVNVDDFRKVISLIGLNDKALARLGPVAEKLARAEGLTGHAAAVKRRLEN